VKEREAQIDEDKKLVINLKLGFAKSKTYLTG